MSFSSTPMLKLFCILTTALLIFANSTSLENTLKSQTNLLSVLPDGIHTFFGDITPSLSKVLNADIDVAILPQLHQYILSVSLSCSNSLDICPPQVTGLKSCYNSLIYLLSQRGGVWMEKHHFYTGRKIINIRRMSRNIINNKQNLKKFVFSKEYFSISLAQQFRRAYWKRSWDISDFLLLLEYMGTVCLMIRLKAWGSHCART